ncbi:MAG TPA: YicC/YloC family endoribonuclease [Bryobacteraceae bacterium]|nr:YicC/YloC family endoribonuclease [Bryobacteraceae bacterium]
MTPPIRSMTGFARLLRVTDHGELTITVKSVNHRGLDIHFHLGAELDPFEGAMRTAIKRLVLRGHVDVRASFAGKDGEAGFSLNRALFDTHMKTFRTLAKEVQSAAHLDLNFALAIPGMFIAAEAPWLDSSAEGAILTALTEVLTEFNQFRTREGAELVALLREHNRQIGQAAAEMHEIRARAIPVFQARLNERLKELLRNSNVEPQRLAQEAALLADRSDIGEEIARLQIHAKQLDEIMDAGGEVGKKLDFLLQEMNRETNTILSKTNGIGDLGLRITDLALATKANIEKVREQALNLE